MKMLKTIKTFLIKVKGDWKQIFVYPVCEYGENFSVNYDKHLKRQHYSRGAFFNSWQKQRADLTLGIIERGAKVMDIGSGNGAMLNYLEEHSGARGLEVDIDPAILKVAQGLGIATVSVDVNNFNFINSLPIVDYVTAFEIIEHMPVPETFVANILNKTKKGVILSITNTGYYAHRLRLLFGRFPLQWVVHPGEHVRFWTARDLEFWVKSLGFKIEKIIFYEGLPGLNKICPKLFAQGIIVHIKQKEPS